jgi:hypothetical protein
MRFLRHCGRKHPPLIPAPAGILFLLGWVPAFGEDERPRSAATGRRPIIVALPILARYANGFDANGSALS